MTPEDQSNFADLICTVYTNDEIHALEDAGHRLDVNVICRALDRVIDDAGQSFDLEVVLEAFEATCADLRAAVGEDEC